MPEEVPVGATAWPDPSVLLPHGEGARHIGRVLEFTPGRRVRAAWRIRADSVLFDTARDAVPAWAGIEVMAQCAGLYLGLARGVTGRNEKPLSGFLVGVRRFHVHRETFARDAEMAVEAACDEALVEAGEMGVFECRILCGDITYADARLMLWCAGDETGEA